MIIELIDETRLLISLDEEDMLTFDLTFERFFWKDKHSKDVITELLKLAKEKTGFSVEGHKLMIEAIPQGEGCMILFTLLPKSEEGARKIYKIKNKGELFVYVFDNADNMLSAVKRLFAIKNGLYDSQLLHYKNKYYLVIYTNRGLPPPVGILLSEYANLKGKERATLARILEYGTTVVDRNAVEKIGQHLVR